MKIEKGDRVRVLPIVEELYHLDDDEMPSPGITKDMAGMVGKEYTVDGIDGKNLDINQWFFRPEWVEIVSQTPESQPHTVHPWDALQALKDQGRIWFFNASSLPGQTRVVLFFDGGRWVNAEAPTLSEAVRQAVAKLPVEAVA